MNEETTTVVTDTPTSTTPSTDTDTSTSVQAPSTPSTQPQTDTSGQSQSEESFFDPTKVPQELMPAYKQMQADYTKKTQDIASVRKEHESLSKQAETWSKYQQYVPIIEEMLSSKNQAQQNASPELAALEQQLRAQGYDDNAIELAKMSGQFLLNVFNQKEQAREQKAQQEQSQQKLEADIAKTESLDPRLNDESLVYQTADGKSKNFGEIVANLVAATPNWRQDPVSATKDAIATVDALIGKAKTDGKEELSASVKKQAAKFPKVSSSPQSASGAAKPSTIQEAYAEAKKDLGI